MAPSKNYIQSLRRNRTTSTIQDMCKNHANMRTKVHHIILLFSLELFFTFHLPIDNTDNQILFHIRPSRSIMKEIPLSQFLYFQITFVKNDPIATSSYNCRCGIHMGRMKKPREAYVLFALSALEEWRIDDFSVKQQCPTMCATES